MSLTEKISMVDDTYLSAAALAAVKQTSYLMLHPAEPRWWRVCRRAMLPVGIVAAVVCLVANVPAGVLVGLVVAWWGRKR